MDASSALEKLRLEGSSPESASCGLFKLPGEIVDQILDYCDHDAPFEGEVTIEHYPMNSESMMKPLRLVSKAFSELVIPRIFMTMVLYQHGGWWDNLENIASTPSLALHVKNIKLAHIGYVTWTDNFHHFKEMNYDRYGPWGDFTEHPPAGGSLADYDLSEEASWERYQRWRDSELVMRNHERDNTAPQVALDRFVNLNSIETVGLASMRTIKRKPWMRSHGLWQRRPQTRRYFETGLRERVTRFGIRKGLEPNYSSTHLQTMMIALHNCGKHLNKLVLHRVQELSGITQPEFGLPSLKHLVLDTSNVQCHDPDEETREVSSWILELQTLEIVEIKQNPTAEANPDLCNLLRRARWPKISILELTNVESPPDTLRHFVSQHVHHLEYLRICEPVMDREDWATFKRGVRHWTRTYHGKRFILSENAYDLPDHTTVDLWNGGY
ncbi:MAG: hypothetical protein Q9191_000656 [Dirinaria sp. TL-2023a]